MNAQKKIREYWERVNGEQTWSYMDDSPQHLGGRIRAIWLKRLLREIDKNVSSKTFLDAGCAEGLFVVTMQREAFFSVGCDISLNLLSKNRSLFEKKSNLILCSITNLPFKENSFSVVLCSETLEHIPNWKGALQELLRVACVYLLITIPSYESFLANVVSFLGKFLGRDIRIEKEGRHISIIRLRSILKTLHENDVLVKRIIASHAIYSFPQGYWPPFPSVRVSRSHYLSQILMGFFPNLKSFIQQLDLKYDEKLQRILVTFAGSIIILVSKTST